MDNEYITEVNDHRDNFGPTVLSTSLALEKGEHELTLLSVSLGIAHVIYFNTTPFEVASKGIGGVYCSSTSISEHLSSDTVSTTTIRCGYARHAQPDQQ